MDALTAIMHWIFIGNLNAYLDTTAFVHIMVNLCKKRLLRPL